jgi:hypothetical protein
MALELWLLPPPRLCIHQQLASVRLIGRRQAMRRLTVYAPCPSTLQGASTGCASNRGQGSDPLPPLAPRGVTSWASHVREEVLARGRKKRVGPTGIMSGGGSRKVPSRGAWIASEIDDRGFPSLLEGVCRRFFLIFLPI